MTLNVASRYNPVEPVPLGPLEPAYFNELVAPTRQLVWMVDFDGETPFTAAGISYALGPASIHGPIEFGSVQQINLLKDTFRYATLPFITGVADSPARTPVEPRSNPVRVDRLLEIGENGAYSPLATSAIGEVQLKNDDGALDAILGSEDIAFEGREIRLSVGAVVRGPDSTPEVEGVFADDIYTQDVYESTSSGSVSTTTDTYIMPALSEFNRVFTGLIDSMSWRRDGVVIRITDEKVRMSAPVQTSSYTGGGGIDGNTALAGVTRPLAYGRCFNVSPVMIEPFLLVYQFHHGEARAVDGVYDRGVPLTLYRECATFDELRALVPVAPAEAVTGDFTIGMYASCARAGCFRLGGLPAGRVTADVRGAGAVDGTFEFFSDGTLWSDGTGWASGGGSIHAKTAPEVAITILQNAGIFNVNVDQFRQLDEDEPRDVGLFLEAGGSRSVAECLGYVLASNGCFLFKSGDGLYQLRRLVPPGVEAINIESDNIVAGSLERLPLPWKQPWARWKVRYARNWTPMSDDEIAGAVTPDRRVFLKREAAEAESVDDVTTYLYPAKGAGVVDTALVFEKDARSEAVRRRSFYSRGRSMYRFRSKGIGFRADLGQTVRVQYPRFTLVDGQHVNVVGLREDGVAKETEVTVFG